MFQILQYTPSKSRADCIVFITIFVQGLYAMDYLSRIEHNIIKNFPDITPDELHVRMQLIKHMIAIEHQKKSLRKEYAIES